VSFSVNPTLPATGTVVVVAFVVVITVFRHLYLPQKTHCDNSLRCSQANCSHSYSAVVVVTVVMVVVLQIGLLIHPQKRKITRAVKLTC